MSHISRIKTLFMVSQRDALLAALADNGCQVQVAEPGSSLLFTGVGSTGEAQIVGSKVFNMRERQFGFAESAGTYELKMDTWGLQTSQVDQFIASLRQRYAYHVAMAQLQAQGYTLASETVEDGQIRLVLTRF